MFENNTAKGVHYSRYIMSWIRMGGKLDVRGGGRNDFKKWLESLEIDETDIENIVQMATNGRMELETSASRFIRQCEQENK